MIADPFNKQVGVFFSETVFTDHPAFVGSSEGTRICGRNNANTVFDSILDPNNFDYPVASTYRNGSITNTNGRYS